MKNVRLFVAALSASLWCTSAAAQSVTTTTSTWACSEACTQTDSALNPFDSSLGTLTGITLKVDGLKDGYYTDFPGGTAVLSYDGLMSVIVNGTTYSFDISGAEQDLTVPANGPFHGTFTATGSSTFTIDPSLFATFIGTEDTCGNFPVSGPPMGVCVSAAGSGSGLGTHDIVRSDNAAFVDVIDGDVRANYTLTYFYTPFSAVPEPGTWVMMLFGLGVIGFACRSVQRGVLRSQIDCV